MKAGQLYPDDDHYESVFEERMADLFTESLARLEDGEPIESILASLPAQEAGEVGPMLMLVDGMTAMQHSPVPVRAPQRTAARRAEFFNQVALERSRREVELPAASRPAPLQGARLSPAPSAARPQSQRPRGLLGLWGALQDALTVGQLRLAPLIATLAVAFGGALGLWRVTSASLPGDLTYPIKSWVQMMNLSLTAPEEREALAQEAAGDIQADFAESARRAQARATAGASLAGVTHQETVFLIFDGYDGRLLKFGDIRVVPSFQANPGDLAPTPMVIEGNLQPGSPVWLTVQILPGQAEVVQGVKAVVEAKQQAAAEPTPVVCTPQRPAGWGYYTVARGDTLAKLAESSGGSVREIAGANCLESDVIIAGQMLFLPNNVQLPAPVRP